jgi:uncharacterized oligopeptide transporter (OPT) family protein
MMAVGIGIYLPPTVASVVLAVGAVLAWIIERALKKCAEKQSVMQQDRTSAAS